MTPEPIQNISLRDKFVQLASNWKNETAGYSTMLHKTINRNYLRIIGMGKEAVPLILEDMRHEPDFWFVALDAILAPEEDFVPPEHKGRIKLVTQDWLEYCQKLGYSEGTYEQHS